MLFDLLTVKCVRNIDSIHLQPGAGLNLIVGPNASGKTALLEAIHLLARARSFRTPRIKEVIQREQKVLQISAQVVNKNKHRVSTGIEKGYGTTIIKYEGKAIKTVSEQAGNIPLVTITPDSHILVTGAPRDRRHWLDWAMFHVEPSYIGLWRKYQKSLRNRNNLLKQAGSDREIGSWEDSMSTAAGRIDDFRRVFVSNLQEQLLVTTKGIFPLSPALVLDTGCPDNVDFEGYLKQEREKDRQAGYTRHGPHKADVCFLVEGALLSKTFSRGQIKRFVAALLVAQALTYELINGEKPVFLIDDYAAELDKRAREELLAQLKIYGGQVFLTSTEVDEDLKDLQSAELFHVEHGAFNKVLK